MGQLEIFETSNTLCMREEGLLKTECLPDHSFFLQKMKFLSVTQFMSLNVTTTNSKYKLFSMDWILNL